MNDFLPPLLIVALFPLFGYLALMQLRRAEVKAAEREAQRRAIGYAGHVTDLEPLRDRLQIVKADFATVSRDQVAQANAKRWLVVRSREKLRHFGFFQHHPAFAEPEREAH